MHVFMTSHPSVNALMPQRIAKLLFAGGVLWAIALLCYMPGLVIYRAWLGVLYVTCGFGVFFGWFWRIRHVPSRLAAIFLWVSSLAVNSLYWVYQIIQVGPSGLGIDDVLGFAILGWQMVASVLSIVALIFDVLPQKHNA
ncbi:MAG: hypothetical protein U1F98_10880 [Verrucomicrobiota bacterium]